MKGNESFLIEYMNGHQIKEKVNDETIALLILGACENHGDHLPFWSDFIFPDCKVSVRLNFGSSGICDAIILAAFLKTRWFALSVV